MAHSDTLVERNRAFAKTGAHEDLGMKPNTDVVLVTCLDPRVEPAIVFGLGLGDAPVLRNVGGRVTEAVINDLAYIGLAAESAVPEGPLFEVAVIHHTKCGTAAMAIDRMRKRYSERTGANEDALKALALDPETTVKADVERIRSAHAVPDRISISGHIYDMDSGLLTTVVPASPKAFAHAPQVSA